MKTIINKIIIFSILLCGISCDSNEVFEKELYKKVICVLSDEDYVFTVEHDLNEEVSEGAISIYCGGTNHIDKDVEVEIEPDNELLAEYNRLKHDTVTTEFARELSESRYDLLSTKTLLKADNPNSYSTIGIKLRVNGLSSDSLYMIPLRIKSASEVDVNPKKQRVLYNPMLKNNYSRQKVTTYYKLKGTRVYENTPDKIASVTADKIFTPISKSKVRTLVGTEAFESKKATLKEIDELAIILEINNDSSVTISPYGSVEIEMLGEPGDNSFEERNGIQIFNLHYQYYGYNVDAKRFMWIRMKEMLIRQS